MNIPTIEQCHVLFTKYKVPQHLKLHCQAVSKVATYLAHELKTKHQNINPLIVERLSLLHDLMKFVVLQKLEYPPANYIPTTEETAIHQQLRQEFPNTNEAHAAYLILKDEFPEFAKFFLELEVVTKNPHANISPETHLVHYADWRVMNNKIIPLDERMEYIYQRYKDYIIKKNIDWQTSKQLQHEYEQNIFKHLDFKPDELAQKVPL